jgi:hypothetical protein
MTLHRAKVFEHPMFKDGIAELRREVQSRLPTAREPEIERKMFAQCMQTLEDYTLSLVDEGLTRRGWTVEMLKFDALLVVNRADRSFADDLASVVSEVIGKIGMPFTMKETEGFFTGGE